MNSSASSAGQPQFLTMGVNVIGSDRTFSTLAVPRAGDYVKLDFDSAERRVTKVIFEPEDTTARIRDSTLFMVSIELEPLPAG